MERVNVRVTLKHRKSTNWIRKQIGVTGIMRSIRESSHILGITWREEVTTDGQSQSQNRYLVDIRRGLTKMRCCDDLIRYVGPSWSYITKDSKLWKACRKGFLFREREKSWLMMTIVTSHFATRVLESKLTHTRAKIWPKSKNTCTRVGHNLKNTVT